MAHNEAMDGIRRRLAADTTDAAVGSGAPKPGDVARHMGVRRDGDVTVYGEYLDTTESHGNAS